MLHSDGSVQDQVASETDPDNAFLYDLLLLWRVSAVPALINISFSARNHPSLPRHEVALGQRSLGLDEFPSTVKPEPFPRTNHLPQIRQKQLRPRLIRPVAK